MIGYVFIKFGLSREKKNLLVCIFVCEVEAYTIRPLMVGSVFIKFGLSFKKKMIIHLTACFFCVN